MTFQQSITPRGGTQPNHIESMQYLEKHRIRPLFESLLADLIIDRPKNPKEYMIKKISEVMQARTPRTTENNTNGTKDTKDVKIENKPKLKRELSQPSNTPTEPAPPEKIALKNSSNDTKGSDNSDNSHNSHNSNINIDKKITIINEKNEKTSSKTAHRTSSSPSITPSHEKERDTISTSLSDATLRSSLNNSNVHVHTTPPVSARSKNGSLLRYTGSHSIVETHTITSAHTPGGKTVNQYRLHEKIGKGSYGMVRRCSDSSTGKEYALKILSKASLRKKRTVLPGPGIPMQDALMDVNKEIALMKKISHRNVVQLLEVLDDPNDDRLYMVLEYCPGGHLMTIEGNVCKGGPLEEEKAWLYFRDMVKGLDYLHNAKVIHRDIKPENLLIGVDGCLKIADFGVSLMFEGEDATFRGTQGSPAFLAPEILNGGKTHISGKAVDIWAVGVTLHCMLLGFPPWVGSTMLEVFGKITRSELDFDSCTNLNPLAKDLITRLLDKNPHTRITMDELKNHDWVTKKGKEPVIDVECVPVGDVSEEEKEGAVRTINKLLVLIKARQFVKNARKSSSAGDIFEEREPQSPSLGHTRSPLAIAHAEVP